MAWKVRSVAVSYDRPDIDPDHRATPQQIMNAGENRVLQELERSGDGAWIRYRVAGHDFDGPTWVAIADLVNVDVTVFSPLHLLSFGAYATTVAEAFNEALESKAESVGRNHLIALSVVLNGLDRSGFTASALSAYDAFRFTSAEWDDFCVSPRNAKGYQAADRFDPLAQIDAAAPLIHDAHAALAEAIRDEDPATGPHVPNSMELFLLWMLGAANGARALAERRAGQGQKPWTAYVDAGKVAALRSRFPAFLDKPAVASIDDVMALAEEAFTGAGLVVSKLLDDFFPDEAPTPDEIDPGQVGAQPQGGGQSQGGPQPQGGGQSQGGPQPQGGGQSQGGPQPQGGGQSQGGPQPQGAAAPWMQVARRELGVGRPNTRILDYFAATDYPHATVQTAWCGAFVAFCMKSVGIKPPPGAAGAGNWGGWGKPLKPVWGEVPIGAVLVMSEEHNANKVAHVTMYAGPGTNDRVVKVLGGNQTRFSVVNQENYPKSRVMHVRWPKTAVPPPPPPPPGGGGGGGGGGGAGAGGGGEPPQIGAFTAAHWAKYLDAMGARESNNNYRIVNRLGYCGRWQLGAMALDDLGYVKRGTRLGQLADRNVWTGQDGIASRDDFLANKNHVQDKAVLLYTRMNYRQLVRLKVVSAATPVPTLAGYLAASALVGAGGARALANGQIRADANNVTSRNYFDYMVGKFNQ